MTGRLISMDEFAVPNRAAPYPAERLRELSTELFRVQGEIDRRSGVFGLEWAAEAHTVTEEFHGLVLALLTLTGEPS